MKMIQKLK